MSDTTSHDNLLRHPSIRDLIAQGARDGQITYDQINDLLVDLSLDEEDVENLYDALEQRAVALVDEAAGPVGDGRTGHAAAGRSVAGGAVPDKSQGEAIARTTSERGDAAHESAPSPGTGKRSKRKGSAPGDDLRVAAESNDDLDSLLAELDALIPDDIVTDLVADAADESDDEFAPVEDALKLYLTRMGQVPRLTPEQEHELAVQMRTGTTEERIEAKNKLVEANLRLVVHLARHSAPRTTLSLTDLLQEGNMGLLDAVERYKPESNKNFGSYATWWVRRSLNKAINEHAQSMKLSGELYLAIQTLQRAQRELSQQLGRPPSREELAKHTQLTVPQIEEAQRAAAKPLSLDAPRGSEEDMTEFGERLTDPDAEDVADASDRRELREGVTKAVDDLSDREKLVLQMRFGMGPHAEAGPLSAEDVARILGLSRERVHDLELRALRKLRKRAKGAGLDRLLGE